MYNLPYFKEKNDPAVFEFIQQHPFAFISGSDENNHPVATQVPVLMQEKGGKLYLIGHLMKNTDHHRAFEKNDNVLCVFTGPNTYISARWYTNPAQASTWNYMSVHIRGKLRFLDECGLKEVL